MFFPQGKNIGFFVSLHGWCNRGEMAEKVRTILIRVLWGIIEKTNGGTIFSI
jgi:hypothetical protein